MFTSESGSESDDFTLVNHEDIQKQKEIGVGGFGVVYQARWKDRDVAVKQLHLQRLHKKTETDFKKELKILHELKHPNVIELLGVCMEPGHYALIMELMELGSLYRLLHEEKTQLEWPTRLSIALQAAIAVEYLHSLEPPILHRDIKSPNFLLRGSPSAVNVKICDFGLAKTRNETTRQTGFIRGVVGSLPWTAPEILEMKDHTVQSDIYSLAIVYWEIASYKIPYDGKREDIIRAFILSKSRLELTAETPSALGRIIEKSWAHDPKIRPTSKEIIALLSGESSNCFSSGFCRLCTVPLKRSKRFEIF